MDADTVKFIAGSLTALEKGQDDARGELQDARQETRNSINELRQRVDAGFAQMNGRVRKTEQELMRIKTGLGICCSFTGAAAIWITTNWEAVRQWLIH